LRQSFACLPTPAVLPTTPTPTPISERWRMHVGTNCISRAVTPQCPNAPATAGATAAPEHVLGSVVAGVTAGQPGTTASVPIMVEVAQGGELATLQFAVTVQAVGAAEAVSSPVSFMADAALPASLIVPRDSETTLVGWLQSFHPGFAGTLQVGTLYVPLPPSARTGDRYTIRILSASATTDGTDGGELSGVDGRVKVGSDDPCFGDCNGNGAVEVNEIVALVSIALGTASALECDAAGVTSVEITDLIKAVNNAMLGCGN